MKSDFISHLTQSIQMIELLLGYYFLIGFKLVGFTLYFNF